MKNNNNININVIQILKLLKMWTNKHNGDQDKRELMPSLLKTISCSGPQYCSCISLLNDH